MQKVSIVTDGSCDLPEEIIKKYNIHIAPFQVIFGTTAYQLYGDAGDISKEEFYSKLETNEDLPTTAVPSPKSFMEAFKEAAKDSDAIIGIFISKELSGTIQSAKRVIPLLDDIDITIIDSQVSATCLGLLVIEAAKMAQEGASKKAIIKRIKRLIPDTRLIIVVDTLEYLHRGGRIGKARKLLGETFNFKPVLHFEDGMVASGGKLRGRDTVIENLKFMAPLVVKNAITDHVFIWHTQDKKVAKELQEIMEKHNENGKEILIQEAGPVIGTHIGPKSLGFTYIGEYKPKWLLKKEA
ncbi:MAG: DegV family protein [Asgard group archaeon]|nr:DegV family protein [Asgard group archaeon]